MKIIKILLITILTFSAIDSYAAIPVKLISEALELGLKKSNKVLSTSAKELAEKKLTSNVAKYGAEVLTFTKKGGIEAIEATTKYGDDFVALCAKNPEAIRSLALNADIYVPLSKKIGTDFLKLEAKAAGITKNISKTYGDDAVKILANKDPNDVSKLLGLAKKADTPEASELLLKRYSTSKNPALFIEKIKSGQILAGGVSVALITGVYQVTDGAQEALHKTGDGVQETLNKVGDGVQSGLEEISKNSPEAFSETISNTISASVSSVTLLVAFSAFLVFLLIILIVLIAAMILKGPIIVLKGICSFVCGIFRGIKNLFVKIFTKNKKEKLDLKKGEETKTELKETEKAELKENKTNKEENNGKEESV